MKSSHLLFLESECFALLIQIPFLFREFAHRQVVTPSPCLVVCHALIAGLIEFLSWVLTLCSWQICTLCRSKPWSFLTSMPRTVPTRAVDSGIWSFSPGLMLQHHESSSSLSPSSGFASRRSRLTSVPWMRDGTCKTEKPRSAMVAPAAQAKPMAKARCWHLTANAEPRVLFDSICKPAEDRIHMLAAGWLCRRRYSQSPLSTLTAQELLDAWPKFENYLHAATSVGTH